MDYDKLLQYTNELESPREAILDLTGMTVAQKKDLLQWVVSQSKAREGEVILHPSIQQALFDVAAEETGAIHHRPGNA